MKYLKEALLVPILKNKLLYHKTAIIITFTILSILLSSCSHKFVKLDTENNNKVIEQELLLKIHHGNKLDKVTVYAQIDRNRKVAILDGVGKFDKYVFHMEIRGNQFYLDDHINNEKKSGSLDEFDLLPLKGDDVFEKIDIKLPQPIIFKDKDNKNIIEIFVKKQSPE